jgi:hypothetical protein
MRTTWIRRSLFILGLVAGPVLRASPIDVTFLSGALTGTPGDILTFQGILTNKSGTDIFINGAGITLTGFGPSDSDITDFILNATGLVGNGSAVGPTDLFTVAIPAQFATGQYPGILSVQGGPTANDDAVIGTLNFQVNVNSVPEPSAFSLTLTAILAISLFAGVRASMHRKIGRTHTRS